MKKFNYYVTNYTNLQVGSGDVSGKITINEYQKDYLTGEPIIPATGIKGSLRQHLSMQDGIDKTIEYVFGVSDKNNIDQGDITFLDCKLLAYPVRLSIEMDQPYVYITKEQNVAEVKGHDFIGECESKIELKKEDFIENYQIKNINEVKQYKNTNLLVVSDDVFKKIMNRAPIITRNNIENGESKNVWHEEYVPRFSIFGGAFLYNETTLNEGIHTAKFIKELEVFNTTQIEEMIQIGGNGSIGMGYCRITKREQ